MGLNAAAAPAPLTSHAAGKNLRGRPVRRASQEQKRLLEDQRRGSTGRDLQEEGKTSESRCCVKKSQNFGFSDESQGEREELFDWWGHNR